MSYELSTPADLAAVQAAMGVVPALINVKSTATKKTRRGIGRVQSATASMIAAFCGDSLVAGVGNDGSATGVMTKAFPDYLVARLNALGIAAENSAMCADHGYTTKANLVAYDPRITMGAGWNVTSTKTMGGRLLQSTGASTDVLSFAPANAFDTIEVIYYRGTNGKFKIGVDGGAAIATIDASGVGAILKTTQTCALGTHTVNITPVGDGNVQLIEIRTYASATYRASVVNLGWGGSKAADWAATGSLSPFTGLAVLAPDVMHFSIGANDWIAGTDATAFQASYQTIITNAKAIGDCVVHLPPPSNPSAVPLATQQVYIDIIRNLAIANDVPVVDVWSRVGTWATANSLGEYYDDHHTKATVHADVARMITPLFAA